MAGKGAAELAPPTKVAVNVKVTPLLVSVPVEDAELVLPVCLVKPPSTGPVDHVSLRKEKVIAA